MGPLGVAHRCAGKKIPFPKICHTYPTLMKLYTLPNEDPKKYMNNVTHMWSFAALSIFYQKSTNFANSRNTDIDCIFIHNF